MNQVNRWPPCYNRACCCRYTADSVRLNDPSRRQRLARLVIWWPAVIRRKMVSKQLMSKSKSPRVVARVLIYRPDCNCFTSLIII